MADGSNAHKRLNGWRYDPINARLDFWYKGTRVGYVNASGIFNSAGDAVTGAYADDVKVTLGTDADIALVNRSTILGANTALTGVIVGTPVVPALAANTLIVGNKTADGDILLVTQTGTHSHAAMWVDASAAITRFYSGAGVEILKLDSAAATLTGTFTTTSSLRTTSAANPLGYATGAGGAVTQITNRSTSVTMVPNPCTSGTITTDTTSLAAEASAAFTVTDSAVAIGDTVVASIQSGANGGNTDVTVTTVTNGTFTLRVSNNNASGGTAETGALLINFAIIKAVSA
jgi:hypothetical protein